MCEAVWAGTPRGARTPRGTACGTAIAAGRLPDMQAPWLCGCALVLAAAAGEGRWLGVALGKQTDATAAAGDTTAADAAAGSEAPACQDPSTSDVGQAAGAVAGVHGRLRGGLCGNEAGALAAAAPA